MQYLKLDKRQYGKDGLISLIRGDDWSIEGQIFDIYSNYQHDVSLAGHTLRAFMPATGGTAVEAAVTVVDESCGKIKVDLAASGTEIAELSDDGLSFFVLVCNTFSNTTKTVETHDEPLQIRDRAFRQY